MKRTAITTAFVSEHKAEKKTLLAPWKDAERQRKKSCGQRTVPPVHFVHSHAASARQAASVCSELHGGSGRA